MIRDVTGLNEARDGSLPNKDALVGLQKMAANASNIATKHILDASLFISLRCCENISLKMADVLSYPLTAESLKNSISNSNVAILNELSQLNLHDFGIYLELEPDDEDKAQLEQNIQIALKSGGIALSDAIDIRQIKNIKLANQLLKIKQTQKQKQDQAAKQANIQAQAAANQQTAEKAALFEVQKTQAVTESKIQIEQAKIQFEIQKMEQEANLKKLLMAEEFSYNMQLADIQQNAKARKEKEIEDRKDKRTQIQATQQSKMIEQRKNNTPPVDFESAGFDTMSGFGLEQFDPK